MTKLDIIGFVSDDACVTFLNYIKDSNKKLTITYDNYSTRGFVVYNIFNEKVIKILNNDDVSSIIYD